MQLNEPAVDLSNCDREPIHVPGGIQAFGCLIAISADWMITHASANAQETLGLQAANLVGSALRDHFSNECIHHLRGPMHMLSPSGSAGRLFAYALFGDDRFFDVAIHASGAQFVFEFERSQEGGNLDDVVQVQQMAARLRSQKDLPSMCRSAARAVRAISGYDRVMVYRFAPDDSGAVIAEALEPGMEPFLGLNYPASDIPKQARELYKRNLLRLLVDVDGAVSPLLPLRDAYGQPLDLSMAVTRAVSPIHLEYLRNMGVQATLAMSILRHGELWGMVVCHHRSPRYIGYALRTSIELYVQLLSYSLAELENEADLQAVARARQLHNRVVAQVADGSDVFERFDQLVDEIGQAFPFDGMALYSEGRFIATGAAPTQEEFAGLARFLNTGALGSTFSTDRLTTLYPPAEAFVDRAAGLLALPISRSPRDYIVLFRRELVHQVKWAGNPEKPVQVGSNGIRLTPRQSFAAWQETVRQRSLPWSRHELQAAESLRVTLIEVVLKLADAAHETTLRAHEQQELLIAELNHRVRNILALMRGLVSQGKSGSESVADFTAVLGARIQALARAHDQLTKVDWTPASLTELIQVEAAAYQKTDSPRLQINGTDVLLVPQAFSTVALVVHELVSNCAKYGALSTDSGRVLVTLSMLPDGTQSIAWREVGGPAVQAPKRQGFGTTIIQRSIPFELKGEAEHRYLLSGVEADFLIPAGFVVAADAAPRPAAPVASAPDETPMDSLIQGAVLLVEDNMIIAMDSQDMLEELGASPVCVASSVSAAMQFLDTQQFALAVLDVNLGKETSAQVASRLLKQGVPFFFATGYGSLADPRMDYADVPILRKPFRLEALARIVRTLISQRA